MEEQSATYRSLPPEVQETFLINMTDLGVVRAPYPMVYGGELMIIDGKDTNRGRGGSGSSSGGMNNIPPPSGSISSPPNASTIGMSPEDDFIYIAELEAEYEASMTQGFEEEMMFGDPLMWTYATSSEVFLSPMLLGM